MTSSKPESMMLTPQQQMLSSGTGALIVSLFMTPLDVVKIRLQSQERLYSKKCFLYSNGLMDHLCPRTNGDPPVRALHTQQEICDCKWFNRPKYFSGTADAFLKISRTEGISSLWSGLSPTLVLAVPTTVIYFTMYEQLKLTIDTQRRALSAHPDILSSDIPRMVSLSAGGLARLLAVTLVSPMELVRTKMMSKKMPLSDVHKCLKDLVKTQGVRGLWNGYTATLLRDVPFSALYWPLYEQCKDTLSLYTGNRDAFLVNFGSGAIAGSVASTVTLPFDVIKTIKQIEMGEKDIMGVKPGRSRTNMIIAKELVSEQGVKGLFSGLIPRLLKVAPACAIMISSYEFCKGFFRQQNSEREKNRETL
eukprot:GFUD01053562.1.p1 GENE.GFUD01053562.1~~GFUD01053562.1.p1  ORF type:complete len:363 (+),score=83.94 GFUD01053562.1:278-1366(+)